MQGMQEFQYATFGWKHVINFQLNLINFYHYISF